MDTKQGKEKVVGQLLLMEMQDSSCLEVVSTYNDFIQVAAAIRILMKTYRIGAAPPIYRHASLIQLIPSPSLLALVPSKYTQGAKSRIRRVWRSGLGTQPPGIRRGLHVFGWRWIQSSRTSCEASETLASSWSGGLRHLSTAAGTRLYELSRLHGNEAMD